MKKKKLLILGNEYLDDDSLAKSIISDLSDELDCHDMVMINNSFELANFIDEDIVILDVVEGLEEVKILGIDDLKDTNIMSAHDFDASHFLKLYSDKDKIKIIGIPVKGDKEEIKRDVIKAFKSDGSILRY